MVWWIAGGIAAMGLLVLLVAAAMLMGRVRRLRRVERSLRVRAEQAKQLQEPVLALQQRAEAMQEVLERIQDQVEVRAARKAAADAG